MVESQNIFSISSHLQNRNQFKSCFVTLFFTTQVDKQFPFMKMKPKNFPRCYISEITSEILPPLKKQRRDFWGNNHEIDSNRFIDLTHLNIDLTGVAFKNGYRMTPQVDSCLIKWENVFVGFWVREILVKSMMLSHRNQKPYCKTTDYFILEFID